jgi:uncharacterized protein YaaN involved in tellurite resistance
MTTETTLNDAQALLAEVDKVSAVILPEPMGEVVPLEAASPDRAAEINRRMDEIDLANTQSIIAFGSSAQAELQVISQEMLQDVKNKDVGPAGDSLRQIVTTIRGFAAEELDLRREASWWERLLGKAAPFAEFVAQYEDVQSQIDRITEELLGHETTLLKDIKSLDLLYAKTLNFYDELAIYIAAGEALAEGGRRQGTSPPRRPRSPPHPRMRKC